MTDMPACLGGAVLELQTHFSLLKINISHAPPPWFSRGNTHPKSINKGERNNAHSMNCCRGLSLFSATIMTKLHFCEFGLPPTLPIREHLNHPWVRLICSQMISLPVHGLEWCYLGVFVYKWFIGDTSSSNYRGIVGFRTEYEPLMMMMWITSELSWLRGLLQIWFLCLGNLLCASEKKSECSLLLSLTVFNHRTSCGKLTSGHNSRPYWSGLCAITSISLTWQ